MYQITKNEVPMSKHSEVRACTRQTHTDVTWYITHTHTHRFDKCFAMPHSCAAKICSQKCFVAVMC